MDESIFKAYDVRGTYPDQINEAAAQRIAGAYATYLQLEGKTVAVGRDVRLSSPSLQKAVIEGLTEAGVNVLDIGCGPTELVYFAVGSLNLDGGIQVSASHNPAEYNGLKLIKKGVEAISSDTGLNEIKALALGSETFEVAAKSTPQQQQLSAEYLHYITKLVDLTGRPSSETSLLPGRPKLRIVANNNFGTSGPLAKKALEQISAPVELIELNFTPDGSFPKGRPDPLIAENRAETSQLVRDHGADLAVSWDADGDRCYIADENGEFIEGCHLTALLAEHLLAKNPGQKVIYDPRNVWAVEETVKAAGGEPILNKAGHTFIKNRMKTEQALFAGEMSGHFYYRSFWNADNGLLTFLTFLELLAKSGKKVSELAAPLREKYFVSGEINFRIKDSAAALGDIKAQYGDLPAPLYTVYVIRCDDNSFYVGQTDNLFRRWEDHKHGKVSWTAKHKPLEIIHYEQHATRESAVKREKDLKTGFGRKWLKRQYQQNGLAKWDEKLARQAGGHIDLTDGLSVDHGTWRFNLRPSNTEPLLRLNVEARDERICMSKTNQLTELLGQFAAKS